MIGSGWGSDQGHSPARYSPVPTRIIRTATINLPHRRQKPSRFPPGEPDAAGAGCTSVEDCPASASELAWGCSVLTTTYSVSEKVGLCRTELQYYHQAFFANVVIPSGAARQIGVTYIGDFLPRVYEQKKRRGCTAGPLPAGENMRSIFVRRLMELLVKTPLAAPVFALAVQAHGTGAGGLAARAAQGGLARSAWC